MTIEPSNKSLQAFETLAGRDEKNLTALYAVEGRRPRVSGNSPESTGSFMRRAKPNKSLQATRDGRSSSAIAEDVISPARLSSGAVRPLMTSKPIPLRASFSM